MADKTFFYPNACHVCKKWRDVKLKSCAKCQMISYCSNEHQQQHWPQHQEICAAIKLVLEDKKHMNTEEISAEEWYYIREAYANKVAVKLQRYLKNEEREMFLFPKACVVCHRQDTLIECKDCPCAAFCNKHRYDSEHRGNCTMLWETFTLRKFWSLTEKVDISYIDRLSHDMGYFNDMTSFLNTYVPLNKNDDKYLQMLHSHMFTMPLTVYFCIQRLDYSKCETLSIHVMGPRIINCESQFKAWTILLLLIPNLTTLIITFIQTESMLSGCDISREVLNVSDTKKLEVYMRYMLYEEYMGTTDFKKPNFMVGFQSYVIDGIYAKDIYVDISEISGKVLAEKGCPCILIFEYMKPIHKQMLNEIKNYFFETNPFTSTMLYRNHVTGHHYCANNYLIIFTNLDSSNVFIDKENKFALFTKIIRE